MARIDGRDAASLLDLVHDGARDTGTDPIPPSVLFGLATLIPSDACVGYQEADVSGKFRVVELVEVIGTPVSPTAEAAFHSHGWQNPLHCALHANDDGVLLLSDFISRRKKASLAYNDLVWRVHGIDDAMRVWLPAPLGRARSVYLERTGRDYTERDRTLLQVLRPHLVRMVTNAVARRGADPAWGLSAREAEVLAWVAHGRTNAEIGIELFISPHTVRKHLESIFEKLGVRTRTAAAAYARHRRAQG